VEDLMVHRRQVMCGAAAMAALPPMAHAAAFKSGRFSVQVVGRGPDVILIPGLDSSRRVWDPVVAHLKGRFRLHLPQIGGFAGEPVGANASGPVAAPVAEDLARYIEANRLKSPAVIGHSMGGTIAMMLAARHPADVGRLMVIDMPPFMGPFFFGPKTTVESARPLAAKMRAGIEAGKGAEREAQINAMLSGMIKTEAARPAYVKEALDSDASVAGRSMEELLTTDLGPELKNITAPLTEVHVWTPQYPMSAEQLSAVYRALFKDVKDARVFRIDDSYHFIMVDQPGKLNAVIDQFLG
jgi:pimeloyl-ACP methyl ester carboxylesterase